MSRIPALTYEAANNEQQHLLDAVQAQLGMVPNFLKVFAHSPAALKAFLGLHQIAGSGSLDVLTRERIALAIAQQNSCEYCVSAHTAIGGASGLAPDEMAENRAGRSQDAKAAVAVEFARVVMAHQGEVTTEEFLNLKKAGYSEAEIVEVLTHIGMNFLTNIIGKVSRVEVDFPKVAI